MPITIPGFTVANKRPGFYGSTNYGASPISLLTIPLVLLFVGQKDSSGSMQADLDVVTFNSDADADTFAGAGSELAWMEYTARAEGSGYIMKGFAPAAAGGGASATATITFVGSTSTAGQWIYWFDGNPYVLILPSGYTATQSAAALVTLVNNDPRVSVVLSNISGVVTATDKVVGVRGNRKIIYQDKSLAPGTQTSAVTGGSSVTGSTNVTGVYFTSGSGVETLTNTLSVLFAGLYDRMALATNDATSLALWVTQENSKAGSTEGRLEHSVFGSNDTLSNATTIAQTTVNNQRFQCIWVQNCEAVPSRLAAAMASVRASVEGAQPNSGFDGYTFATIPGQRFSSDWASNTTQESALNNSITPGLSNSAGKVSCVRSITTRSLNGAVPDYRTIDTSQATTPDFIRTDLSYFWTTGIKPANPYNVPEPPSGAKKPAAKTLYPSRLNALYTNRLLTHQAANIITGVDTPAGAPQSEWNDAQQCIMTEVPCMPTPLTHQTGMLVSQFAVTQ
jgi:phage tail sheath gpL-like